MSPHDRPYWAKYYMLIQLWGKAPSSVWCWEELNKRGRWVRLRWMMDEESAARYARKHGLELRKVEASREERQDYYGEGYGHVPRK